VHLRVADPSAQTLALVAGLSLIEAIDTAIPDQALMLKWPNDVLLLGRKVAGILLERTGDRVVVGFGVNLAVAPSLPDRRCAALGGEVDPHDFAPLLAASFARLLGLWRESKSAMILHAWRARAHPIGTRLTVHSTGEKSVTGLFDGLEPDGGLRLRLPDGRMEILRAGDVSLP
jgi:BirA family biotin operon repressor/biotin-[acetyl-CoA-carboxylase] ligase